MPRYYFDYAATTPVDERVRAVMNTAPFGNARSIHHEGMEAKRYIDEARKKVANALSVSAGEVVFTHGGTDANFSAILGAVESARIKNNGAYEGLHVVTTTIEHSSVLNVMRSLERRGVSVTCVSVPESGLVTTQSVSEAVTEKTVLVSVCHVNNEIGTVAPIRAITNAVKEKNPHTLVHTDACQSPLCEPLFPHSLGVDLMSVDAQKIYGPKGVGVLFVKQGTTISPRVGGVQERGVTPGTEPAELIGGMAEALLLAVERREGEAERVRLIRDEMLSYIGAVVPQAVINGSTEKRVANNINISLVGVDTEYLTVQLDGKGFAVSTKSTCEQDAPYSHVVYACTNDVARAQSTLRITLGRDTTLESGKKLVDTIAALLSSSL